MFLTGFADEAGRDFAVQIKATKELGWKFIEARNINGKNLATLTDEEFDKVCEQLDESGISINCFGSGVANWAKDARKEEDFQASLDELNAAIPRMQKLGIKLIRGMSFVSPPKDGACPDSPEIEAQIFKKVRRLVEICADNGIVYGHENCMNYGGLSYKHTLRLLENVNHENLKLIYDTGNPCFNYRWIGEPPYALQSSWEFYSKVKEHIVYVHIKDGIAVPGDDCMVRPPCKFTYAGFGNGDVRAIVSDLLASGYDGGFSMEPHLAVVFHEADGVMSEADVMYRNYVTYGQKFEELLRDCGWKF
ncbi:MAG: sugar phosphate isomerase/epimerase [Lentisphaerae bacterium]|nr:sugar phosphate isomerase/epimerase [Lentisphaerota bacterium]MBQ4329063.1 sugar phosphate isomerase/epimerase [Lentisphaeria bacterium]